MTDTCLNKPSAVEQNRPEERLVGPAAPITGLVPRTLPPPLRRMRLRGRENRLELASPKEILRLTSERPKWRRGAGGRSSAGSSPAAGRSSGPGVCLLLGLQGLRAAPHFGEGFPCRAPSPPLPPLLLIRAATSLVLTGLHREFSVLRETSRMPRPHLQCETFCFCPWRLKSGIPRCS